MKLLTKIYTSTFIISISTCIIFIIFGFNEFESNANNSFWHESSYSNWNSYDYLILNNKNITSINMNYKNNKNILNYFKGYYNDNINLKLLPFYSIFNNYAIFYINNKKNNDINIVAQYEELFYNKGTLNILDYPNKKKIVNKIVKEGNNIYNIYNENNELVAKTNIYDNFNKYIIFDINNSNNQINITINNNNLNIVSNNEFISLKTVLGILSYSLLDTINKYSINILAKTMFYFLISLFIISVVLVLISKYNCKKKSTVNNDIQLV